MLITCFNNRDSTMEFTIKDADGVPIVLQAGDKIRIKIGQENETPIIDLEGGVASGNGSINTNANPTVLTLDRADITLLGPGIWQIEIVTFVASAGHDYYTEVFELEIQGTQEGDL